MKDLNNEPKVSVTPIVGWQWAKKLALRTVGKKVKNPFPTREQKLEWLIGEHSQIKAVQYCIDIDNLRQWVGVHLLRHPFQLPFISTQRADRQKDKDKVAEEVLSFIKDDIVNDPYFPRHEWRDYRLQGAGNDHTFVVNAQTLINMSRKRLCQCSSKETRDVWNLVRYAISEVDPELALVMVPNCIYRGFCPEKKTCRYCFTRGYERRLKGYRNLINTNHEED